MRFRYESRILLNGIRKALVRAPDYLFGLRLTYPLIRITVIRYLYRFIKAVYKKNRFSGQKTGSRLLDRLKIGRIRNAKRIF